MKNEFITYEQAVALKELGFDERCFGHYNPNGVFFWKILCSDEDNDHTLSVKDIMEHVADGYVEAPLYQQAFKFLRYNNKYRFYIILCSQNKKHLFEITLPSSIVYTTIDEHAYDTYEEAERDLLDKLIEIIKNK